MWRPPSACKRKRPLVSVRDDCSIPDQSYAELSEDPLIILFVGVVPLVVVTYLQFKGTIGMGMKVKDQ